MKHETILQEIKNYLENRDITTLENLKTRLEEDIRKETSYKTSSKSRVNAINKMMKFNTKKGYQYTKCFNNDSKYQFTNSYYMVEINDSLGYEIDNTKNYNQMLDRVYNGLEPLKVDLDDLMSSYKLKEKYYNINGVDYDLEYLKQVIDIIGLDIVFYQDLKEEHMLYYENKDNERGVIIGTRTF